MLMELGHTHRPPAPRWPLMPQQLLAACERALRCCHILWFPIRAAASRQLQASTCRVQLKPHGNASAAVQLSLRIRLPCATASSRHEHVHITLPGAWGASSPFHLAWSKPLSSCAHTSPLKPFTPGYCPPPSLRLPPYLWPATNSPAR